MALVLPPPPSSGNSIPPDLYRWLYLAYNSIISLTSSSGGTFGPPGTTTPGDALVPGTTRNLDYLDLEELVLNGTEIHSTATELNQIHGSSITTTTLLGLQSLSNYGWGVNIVVGAEAANVISVGLTFTNGAGNTPTGPLSGTVYLSDNVSGNNFSQVIPTGGIAAGTGNLAFIGTTPATNLMSFVTNSSGACTINITDAGTPTWYLCVIMPFSKTVVSTAITFA